MATPTVGPKNIMHGQNLVDASIRSPKLAASAVGPTAIAAGAVIGAKLKTDAVGLTALSDALQRHLTVVSYGGTPVTAHTAVVFRTPPSGAKLSAAYWFPGSVQNHAANEGDTWVVALKNAKTGLRMSAKQCSLSNQTLAATSAKTIPLNAGRSTLNSGEVLIISCAPSASPDGLRSPTVVLEWAPQNNV